MRVYSMDKFIKKERVNSVNKALKLRKNNNRKNLITDLIINFIGLIDQIALYFILIYNVIYKDMTIANFTFLVTTVSVLTNALLRITYSYSSTLSASLNGNDFVEYKKMIDSYEKTLDVEINEIKSIEFKDVYYSYYKQNCYALNGVSFKIENNEKIALVGYNGAGKTTIVKLLSGLYKPTKGEILINGIDINTIKRTSLAKVISPVFQENIIFSLSLEENITFSNHTNKERFEEVLKQTDLEDKVNSLVNKEKTILTRDFYQTGIVLSGGENQKITIARSIYKDSYLYILDEPTSAMDALSEYKLYNNLNEIVKDKMTIFISHRLSSTKFCDRILFLSEGRIIEEGTHNQLIENDSEYKKLFKMQSDYYGEVHEKN